MKPYYSDDAVTLYHGDSRAWGLPKKNLLGMPWRVAFALQDDGWILRNDIIWHKPNAMPESVTDRLSTRYEHLFLLTKSPRYWFDLDAIRGVGKVGGSGCRSGGELGAGCGAGKTGAAGDTPPGTKAQTNRGATGERHTMAHPQGRNPGDVWELPASYGGKHEPLAGSHGSMGQDGNGRRYLAKYDNPAGRNPGDCWSIPTSPFPGAHFAVFPPAIPRRCIAAGCRPGGTVLDPFSGSGTTGMVAGQLGRCYIGIDLSREYLDLSLRTRLAQSALIVSEDVNPPAALPSAPVLEGGDGWPE